MEVHSTAQPLLRIGAAQAKTLEEHSDSYAANTITQPDAFMNHGSCIKLHIIQEVAMYDLPS
jgi:hypothetical protein